MTALDNYLIYFIHNLFNVSCTDIGNSFPGVGDDEVEPEGGDQMHHQ